MKFGSLLLAVLMAGASLFSCSQAETAADVVSTSETASDEVRITASQFNNYRIIRSEDAEMDIIRGAAGLYTAMIEKAPKITISDDFIKEGSDQFTIIDTEILVGQTNRDETQEFLGSLMPWQYGYGMVNDKIVICGFTDEQTLEALETFETNILSRSELYYSSSDDYIFGSSKSGTGTEYRIANVTSSSSDIESLIGTAAKADASVIAAVNTDGNEITYIPDGYTIAEGGIMYDADVFTYSSSGTYRLDYSDDEGTYMTYAVLRDCETLQKTVFCTVNLPDDKTEQKKMLQTAQEFFDHCDAIPVILCGKYSGKYEDESGTGELLFDSGLCDMARMAGDALEENGVYICGSYSKLSPVSFEILDGGSEYPVYMCTYQRAK